MVGWSMSAAMTAGFLTDDLVRSGGEVNPNALADVFHRICQCFQAGAPVGRFSELNDNNAAQKTVSVVLVPFKPRLDGGAGASGARTIQDSGSALLLLARCGPSLAAEFIALVDD